MKKIFALTAALMLLVICKADAYTYTRLLVHSYDNAPIQVYIDGNAIGNTANQQNFENLSPGYHEMQVTQWVTDEYNQTSEQVVFTGGVTLDQGYSLNTIVNPGGNLQVINEVAIYQQQYAPIPVAVVNFRPYVVYGAGFRGRYYRAPVAFYSGPRYTACRPPVVVYNQPRGGSYNAPRGGGYHNDGSRGGGYHGNNNGPHGGNYSHNGPRR